MPLQKIEKITSERIIGYWKVTEPYELLFEQCNLALEDGSYGLIRNEKKLLEWVCTRLLAEAMLGEFNTEYQGIYKDPWGKPHLNQLDIGISVTHTFPLVIVMMDKNSPVGIDVEPPTPKIGRIAPKFLHEKEQFAQNDLMFQTILWAAKEALFKYHGRKSLSFRQQILIDPFHLSEEGTIYGRIIEGDMIEEHCLTYRFIYEKQYVLVYTS
ncbi:MAG: 4'-phosphopantetheinyl transferase superfamily protein [Cyclobacteriaceae bacterium]|nr:4'-phosphopantetheinyl transferase superfamily protein [Cyclobacteriaceae bacterium]